MEWNGLDWSLTESLVVSLYVTFDVTALDSHYSVWSGTVLGAISFDMTSCGPPWMWHHNHKGFFNSCFFYSLLSFNGLAGLWEGAFSCLKFSYFKRARKIQFCMICPFEICLNLQCTTRNKCHIIPH